MANTLIEPEILSVLIDEQIKTEAKTLVVAYQNNEIAEHAGGTLTKIKYAPLESGAQILKQGDEITVVPLKQEVVNVEVKQAAIGGQVYDIERLKAPEKTVQTYKKKMSTELANSVDQSVFENFEESTFLYDVSTTQTLSTDVVFDAKALFGDSVIEEDLYLFVSPRQYAQIEKEDNGRALTRLQTVNDSVVKGRYAGVNIVVSSRVKEVGGIITNYLVRKDAVEIGIKKGVEVEEQREIMFKRTNIAVDTVFYSYLAEGDGVVKIKVAANDDALTGA